MKNPETKKGRIAKVLVLDAPSVSMSPGECTKETEQCTCHHLVMNVLPTFTYTSNNDVKLEKEIAYMTATLAFNIGLHLSCLKALNVLVQGGEEPLEFLCDVEEHDRDKVIENQTVVVELASWTHLPRYASHLRVSFVKVPECGMLGSLRGTSVTEIDDRQNMIDVALNKYFEVDRVLARGDVFCIHILWNCGWEMCASCCQKTRRSFKNTIYFKVEVYVPHFCNVQS